MEQADTTNRFLLHPQTPSEALSSSIKGFLNHFYDISDLQDRNGEWVEHFAYGATLVMGSNVGKGLEEIRALRELMWKEVSARKHRTVKVFIGGVVVDGDTAEKKEREEEEEEECELIILGSVNFTMKTGEQKTEEWAAQGRLKIVDKKWRWVHYRVYLQRSLYVLDSEPLSVHVH